MIKNKFLLSSLLILIFSFCIFAQTKSIADTENQIKNFNSPANFSVAYDISKYVTKAELSFDLLTEKDPLEKQFKSFSWQIFSLFAIEGIDTKPVRNTLCIITQSKKGFKFASDRNLNILLDSEEINLGEADRSTELKGRKATETLCWEIDSQLIKDFASANKLELQVGNFKRILNASQLQSLKDYSELIEIKE